MIGNAEELLKWLWSRYKYNPISWIILLQIVFVAILLFVALISDIGFSDEVKKYRIHILLIDLVISSAIAIIGWIVHLKTDNDELRLQVINLDTKLNSTFEQIHQKDEANKHSQQTILNLIKEITKGRIFEVNTVQLYKERLHFKIKKRRNLELTAGNEIRVFDIEEGTVMGVFEITDIQQTEFIARDIYVNPVWSGYVNQTGKTESSIPPNTIAVLFLKEEFTNNE